MSCYVFTCCAFSNRRFLGAYETLRTATVSIIMSVRPSEWNNSAPSGPIFWKLIFFLKSVQKVRSSLKFNKNNGYFTWRPIHIFITSRSILLRMRNISDINCTESQNTCFTFNNLRKSRILWENVVKYCTAGQATDDNMALSHWKLGKCGYIHTLLEYVILTVFPLQKWLHERASMLRPTYIACLRNNKKDYVNSLISDFKTCDLAVRCYKHIDQSPCP